MKKKADKNIVGNINDEHDENKNSKKDYGDGSDESRK